jgi:hypothetical protein
LPSLCGYTQGYYVPTRLGESLFFYFTDIILLHWRELKDCVKLWALQ